MLPTTISEVIAALDIIIAETEAKSSPLGYFAALYRTVTVRVKEGIERGEFQDNARMERLDIIFANRYLEAYAQYKQGQKATTSWQRAFDVERQYWPIVLQHLLLGMNAHINLDLGIAAAQTSPGLEINNLQADFNKINEILAELTESVEKDLANIWPTLKLMLKVAGKMDNFMIGFSMSRARDGAWKFATQLAAQPAENWPAAIAERDRKVAAIANLVAKPGPIIQFILGIIRISEKGNAQSKIQELKNN